MPARRRNVTWRLFAGFLVWAAGIVAATAQSAPSGGVRDVSPPGTTRFYREAGKESREKTVMLYDVMVLDTGALTDRATIVPLPIRLPERTRLCQTLQGGRWSCGAWARMALRNMVERAAVRCRANAGGAATAPVPRRRGHVPVGRRRDRALLRAGTGHRAVDDRERLGGA